MDKTVLQGKQTNRWRYVYIVKPEDTDSIGPDIMYNEFEKALSELKNSKSEGIDNIPADLLKALGRKEKHELFEICKQIITKKSERMIL